MRINSLHSRRRPTSVSLDDPLVEVARALAETRAAREAAFIRDNAAAFAARNNYHKKYSMPFADLRPFRWRRSTCS